MRKTLTPRFLLLGLLTWLLSGVPAFAQSGGGTISGRVIDAKGEPVIGATILVPGTTKGAATDVDGNFTIREVPAGTYKVTISSVGMNTSSQDVTVTDGNTATVNATMAENATLLAETVVVGYGTQSRRELTGAVAQVKAEAFANTPLPSFDAALQGRAAGVQVAQSNGAPGSQVRVRVRGQASLSGSSDPLYVVDGIPINNGDYSSKNYGATSAIALNPLAAIDPNEIESIEVLKDAAAGAIYGARAANGVIIITTKRGKAGKTNFSVNYSTGVSNPARRLKFLNGSQWRQLYYEAYQNDSTARRASGNNSPLAFPLSIQAPGGYSSGPPAVQLGNTEAEARRNLRFGTTDTDWFDEVFQQGRFQDASVSASGGTDKTRFYLSGGYNTNESFLKGNKFQRFSTRLNVDHTANDRLTVGTSIGTYYTINDQVATSYNGGLGLAQGAALPIYPVRNPDGSYFGTQPNVTLADGSTFKLTTGGVVRPSTNGNPAAQLENKFVTTNFRNISTIYLNFKLFEGLVFRTENSLDYYNQYESFYFSPVNRYAPLRTGGAGAGYNGPTYYQGLGAMSERRVNIYNLNTNNFFTYSKDFNESNRLKVTLGSSVQSSSQRDMGFEPFSEGVGFVDPYYTASTATTSSLVWHPDYDYSVNTRNADGTTSKVDLKSRAAAVRGYNSRDFYRFASFFSRINYSLLGRYIAEVSLRTDGSSRFGSNKRFGAFPAVSGAWIVSDEAFLRDQTYLSLLKLRASYGITGNSELGGNFKYAPLYGNTAGYLGVNGFAPTQLENPDLQWERNRQYDLGLDFGVLSNRITGTVTYFHRTADRLLLNRPAQTSASGLERIPVNSRVNVRNQGIELNLTSRNITTADFSWTTDLNMSFIRNKVVDVDGINPDGFDSGGPGDARVILGYPVGTNYLYQWAGVDPQTGLEGIYVTRKTTGKRDSVVYLTSTTRLTVDQQKNDRVASGKPFPKFSGGLNNTFTYKGIDLGVLLTFSYGNTIYDDGGKYQFGGRLNQWNQAERITERWTREGQQTDIPKLSLNPANPDNFNTTRYLYDGSFLRVRQAQLGYTLPKAWLEKINMERVRVYVSGTNLLTWTKYPGWDPESVRYADAGDQTGRNNGANLAFASPYLPTPQARTITVGVNLGF